MSKKYKVTPVLSEKVIMADNFVVSSSFNRTESQNRLSIHAPTQSSNYSQQFSTFNQEGRTTIYKSKEVASPSNSINRSKVFSRSERKRARRLQRKLDRQAREAAIAKERRRRKKREERKKKRKELTKHAFVFYLPPEILGHVYTFLPIKSAYTGRLVCHDFLDAMIMYTPVGESIDQRITHFVNDHRGWFHYTKHMDHYKEYEHLLVLFIIPFFMFFFFGILLVHVLLFWTFSFSAEFDKVWQPIGAISLFLSLFILIAYFPLVTCFGCHFEIWRRLFRCLIRDLFNSYLEHKYPDFNRSTLHVKLEDFESVLTSRIIEHKEYITSLIEEEEEELNVVNEEEAVVEEEEEEESDDDDEESDPIYPPLSPISDDDTLADFDVRGLIDEMEEEGRISPTFQF